MREIFSTLYNVNFKRLSFSFLRWRFKKYCARKRQNVGAIPKRTARCTLISG